MDKPQYANAFTATFNPQIGEVVFNFNQDYPSIGPLPESDEPGIVHVKTEVKREHVCGVVLPVGVAKQLIDVLKQNLVALPTSAESDG